MTIKHRVSATLNILFNFIYLDLFELHICSYVFVCGGGIKPKDNSGTPGRLTDIR